MTLVSVNGIEELQGLVGTKIGPTKNTWVAYGGLSDR
jgi:hypothetical protein